MSLTKKWKEYKPEIGIILTTVHRDDLLMETVNSILDIWQDTWKLYIVDQNTDNTFSEEKRIFYETACSQYHNKKEQRLEVIRVPYDSGLSYSRNIGVTKAFFDGAKHVVIGADSIKFTESMSRVDSLKKVLQRGDFDLIGLDLENKSVGWEAKLKLIKNSHFELNFIERNKLNNFIPCDIVRNFFIATTESLFYTQWDFNLKIREHEDFFWRYKQNGYKVAWTPHFKGRYIGKKEGKYSQLRQKNMKICKDQLLKKYNLKKWVEYINLERATNLE